jgi:predicted metal-dependent hydrolase
MYDNKIHVLNNALGLHTAISRVQGGKLKAKAEIRVATVFRDAPEDFLRMIVVHELAHLKEKSTTRRSISCAAIWSRSTISWSLIPACG